MKLRNKKTGEIYELNEFCLYDDKGYAKRPFLKSLAELNEEWEDYEEKSKDNEYWYIDDLGRIQFSCELLDEIEEHPNNWLIRKLFGNYFKTRGEAKKAVEKLKAWTRLRDRGFEFCGYEALGCGEIHFTSDWDIEDEYEKGQRRKDLHLIFGGEE